MGKELPDRIFFSLQKLPKQIIFLLTLTMHTSLKLSGEKRWASEGLNGIRIRFQLFFLIQLVPFFPLGDCLPPTKTTVSAHEKFKTSCSNKLPIAIQLGFNPTPKSSSHESFTLENTSCYCTLGFHTIPALSSIISPQPTNSVSIACTSLSEYLHCTQSVSRAKIISFWAWNV